MGFFKYTEILEEYYIIIICSTDNPSEEVWIFLVDNNICLDETTTGKCCAFYMPSASLACSNPNLT